MKKTTLALFTSIFAIPSASAFNLVDNQEYGTKLDFVGSARIMWRNTSDKETDVADGSITREHINHAVQNNGSRFGFKLSQSLTNDFYVLGRVEWRFRGTDNNGVEARSQHNFDHIYTRQLYAGIGHSQYGELTYGNQTVLTDEVKQTDLPNTLSLSDGLLVSGARRTIQYVYTGNNGYTKGLKIGAFYGNRSPRGNNGLSLEEHRKDIWGGGAIQKFEIDEYQELVLSLGTTKERFERANLPVYSRTAYAFGSAYTYDDTTLGLDLERQERKNQDEAGAKRTYKEIRTVLYHKITPDWRAYTMYAYKTEKRNDVDSTDRKDKTHQFMLGSEYYLIPKNTGPISLKTFLEWQATRTKEYRTGELRQKERNYTTVIGLRAYW
ncbi:porin [Actinobacillus succinogenes]|uniref:Porin Gram-negative type n=1 Tax=Actinobacillus succinogenes (strain ATCC 55618 / DSM 22257 / CCUG 43843 / 130Z) TaxID=339671 RepID=A6VKE5_ACTSZ|nr:porin [Actinobacillus succinogenes]ABR73442.1 porin Gram-negative type [Actinobacillus succinogenes 130Z]PHI40096.1 porin [Actinobacillus succinogenes]